MSKNLLINVFITFFCLVSQSKTLKIAVIDTGLNNTYNIPLCKEGHKDFTNTDLRDNHGHGTNISYLINEYAGKGVDYCQIILKVYDYKSSAMVKNSIQAFEYLTNIDVDIINYSGGGRGADAIERAFIKRLLLQGKVLVVAAGNDGNNLNRDCNYYPACYDDNIIVVGNGSSQKQKEPTSNWGSVVDVWIDGVSKGPDEIKMTGTSQSTAILTGSIIQYYHSRLTKNNPDEQAFRKALEAWYEQSGTAARMNVKLKKIQRQLPEEFIESTKVIYPFGKIMLEKRIEHTWEF